MHILRPLFAMDRDDALAFASHRGFGLVVAADESGPRASHVPFVVTTQGLSVTIHLHFTALNPLVAAAERGARFLVVAGGADAYVSNDWYASPDQVSTWLYEAVHLSGPARLRPLAANRGHGDSLLAVAEARLPKPAWTLDAMEPGKRATMLDAIRVVDIAVDRVEGQSKLNQHKSDADHVSVANHLARADCSASRSLARRMRRLRPHLVYEAAD